jgi:hypothetical protein
VSHIAPIGAESQETGIVRITGRHRLPSDVVSELKHVLAENPQIVLLDLTGAAGDSHLLSAVLDPVAHYLAEWPGTAIAVAVPDPATSASLVPPTIHDRVLVAGRAEDGVERARQMVPRDHRVTTFLRPVPQASDTARAFTRRTLRAWRLEGLIWPASLVVSELVTHSILQTETALDLTLSRAADRVRIAVHDHGSDSLRIKQLASPTNPLEDPLHHRGLLVVRALTRSWGVFPSRDHGKTVWAVMDAD